MKKSTNEESRVKVNEGSKSILAYKTLAYTTSLLVYICIQHTQFVDIS